MNIVSSVRKGSSGKNLTVTAICLLLIWFFFLPYVELALVILLIALTYLIKNRSKLAILMVFLCPVLVLPPACFVEGVCDYYGGNAKILSRGLPGIESFNLNREYRLYRSLGGCTVFSSDTFTREVYYYAVKRLIKKFGPMRGSYIGPYPTRKEAYTLIRKSDQKISVSEILSGSFMVNKTKVSLESNLAHRIAGCLVTGDGCWPKGSFIDRTPDPGRYQNSSDEFLTALIGGECLLVANPELGQRIMLVDVKGSQVFAIYFRDDLPY